MGGLLMCFVVEELFVNKRQNQPWGLVVEYHTIDFYVNDLMVFQEKPK